MINIIDFGVFGWRSHFPWSPFLNHTLTRTRAVQSITNGHAICTVGKFQITPSVTNSNKPVSEKWPIHLRNMHKNAAPTLKFIRLNETER